MKIRQISIGIITAVMIVLTAAVSIYMPYQVSANTSADIASVDARLETAQAEVRAKDTVTLDLRMENHQGLETGINAYKATLDYDQNVFEPLTQEDFVSQNRWSDLEYNPSNHQVVAINLTGSKTAESVAHITLRVKENAAPGATAIRVKEITTSEGKYDIIENETEAVVSVIQSTQADYTQPNGTQTGNAVIQNVPATGDMGLGWGMILLIMLAIDALLIAGLIVYCIKRKKDLKKAQKYIIGIVALVVLSLQVFTPVYAEYASKGELNDDGVVDLTDAHLLERHLIGLELLPDSKLRNADMNSDGQLTVTDLTLLVQTIEKELNYEVNLFDSELETYFPGKNQNITLRFFGSTLHNTVIEKAVINGIEYPVEQVAGVSGEYAVIVNTGETAGIKEFQFSEVTLNNGKKIQVDYSVTIDILKDAPMLENYVTQDDIDLSQIHVSFDLTDADTALISAHYEILDESMIAVENGDLQSGQNSIDFTVEESKKYYLNLYLHYNLDSNVLETEEDHTGMLTISKELQMILDYQFTMGPVKTYKADVVSSIFEKNEPIVLGFESSNATAFYPEHILVNGTGYAVTKNGNRYEATLDGMDQAGFHTLTVTEVILNNGKKFNVQDSVDIEVLKQAPQVENLQVQENTDTSKLTAEFTLNDADQTLQNARVVLYDSNGTEISSAVAIGPQVSVELDTQLSDSYVVKVIADYNLSDNDTDHQYQNQILLEQPVIAKAKAIIENAGISNTYPQKQEALTLTYTINSNKTAALKKLIVSSVEYPVTPTGDKQYTITVNAAANAGIQQFTATRALFADGSEAVVNNTLEADVLKNKPSVENYDFADDISKQETILSFELMDLDGALESAIAVLEKRDGSDRQEQPVTAGQNTLNFYVEESQIYDFHVIASYDRDSNTLSSDPNENKVTNEQIFTQNVELLRDYQLNVDNLTTYRSQAESKYFAKNEAIELSFTSTNVSPFYPKKAVVNGVEYPLTKAGDTYRTVLNGFENAGVQNFTIEKIILDNAKELTVDADHQISVEVLKDVPEVSGITYEETVDSQLHVKFTITDNDQALKQAKVEVYDETGTVLHTQSVFAGEQTISFVKTNANIYTVKVLADYDLDSNEFGAGDNEYQNEELLSEEIDVSVRMYEIKDVINTLLYRKTDNGIEEMTQVSLSDLADLSQYVLQIDMKDAPTLYVPISDAQEKDEQLLFTLDLPDYVQYKDSVKQSEIEILYGAVENGVATTTSFSYLLQQMRENPTGSFMLQTDVDMTAITSTDVTLLQEFRGTLDGNGHTIYNLSKPLFQTMSGAAIQNIVFDNASLSSGATGLIANRASASRIFNVHVRNLTITASASETGALIGTLTENSEITNSSVRNFTLVSNNIKRMGGMVGGMANSTISNSYVQGSITSSQDGVGGITGFSQNGRIEKCVASVTLNTTSGPGYNGGIVGHSSNLVLKDTVSLSTGAKGNRIHGTGINGGSSNNYELESSTLISNSSSASVNSVSEETVMTVDFYRNTARFDETIWSFDEIAANGLPALRNADPDLGGQTDSESSASQLYIPEYQRLKSMKNYDAQRDMIYANLYTLMPFYDAAYLVTDGNSISTDHVLNHKRIKAVLPFDSQGKMVEILTDDTYDTLSLIKLVFEDGSVQEYNLSAAKKNQYFANYTVTDLNIGYNYANYLVNQNTAAYQSILTIAQAYHYTDDLDPLTSEEDSRIYRDHYMNQTAARMNGVLTSILGNTSQYNLYSDNAVAGAKIVHDLTSGDLLKQLLYAYNYYDRWYDFEVGGVNMRSALYLDGALYNRLIEPVNMSQELLKSNYRATNSTHNYYANSLAKYTGKTNIGVFIDDNILMLTDYIDVNDWFADSFSGMIYEVGIEGYDDVQYRAWKHVKQRTQTLLPALTLPENSGYIVSVPSQILFGSLRSYTSDPTDEANRQTMYTKMVNWGNLFSEFYTTTVGFADGAVERMNSKSDLGIDTRYVGGVWQIGGETEDPFIKNFTEVCGLWAAANGSAAYATGANTYWVAYTALNAFSTASHETGHNQDGYIFLEGYGRRRGGYAEDYADGNTTQGSGDGGVNFNLAYNNSMSVNTTINLTTERINSKEKIYSYYKGMFEAVYYLDYVEAMAFLQLTPEEQAQIGTKVYYPNKEEDPNDEGEVITGYRPLTVEETTAMNLQTIEDLWDNRINLKVNNTQAVEVGTNRYGADGIYSRVWYQPHNNNGRPDSYSFKRLAWEMLGVGGYTNGYVAYYSGKNPNDLVALRDITGDSTMTFKTYKMNRFDEIAQKIQNGEDVYTDYDALLQQYLNAMRADAKSADRSVTASTNIRRTIYHYLKRITNDFRSGIYENSVAETHITTAQQLVEQVMANPSGMFVLDNDLDFTDIADEASVINTTFMGCLNGNGHTITGLTKPLFKEVKFANIYDLIMRDSNVIGEQETGALSKTATNIMLKNVHITDSTISGTGRTGGLIGYVTGSYATECSANVTVNATNNAVGGMFGELVQAYAENCYAAGSLVGNADIGGFTGYANSTKIINCYSTVSVRSLTTNAAGGFVGRALNNALLQNNVSFGNTQNAFKFDGRSAANIITDRFANNYEYEDAVGSSTLVRSGIDFTDKISVLSADEAKTQAFYISTLGWDATIWDLSNVTNGGLPKLRDLDPNHITLDADKTDIATVEDFVNINNNLNGIYRLTADLDFSDYACSDAVITGIFTGRLEGNGYTIRNLNNSSLFKDFRGTVQNLNIDNFVNQKSNTNFIAAFTQTSYQAAFKNMRFSNITLTGKNNVAPISGMDGREGANSLFERISVTNANVTGSGVYVSAFVGRKFGGTIRNCNAQGSVSSGGAESAGLLGASQQAVEIENVFVDVDFTRTQSSDERLINAGFVANFYNTPAVRNSISVGNVSCYGDNVLNKITTVSEENIINFFTNCFEFAGASGSSNMTENTAGKLDEATDAQLHDVAFYRDTLGFDEAIWDLTNVAETGKPILK